MNHIYHSVWNEALGAWIAVSEIAKGQGKRSSNRRKILATGLLLCTTPVWALPTGDQLIAGQATVNTPNAGQMQINQASQNAVINWQGFSIAPTEAVTIQQPNAQAALLNRVVGADASQIQGKLTANGQVYLVNPNGVLFSNTAQVDVGGLVASTHNISNADFMAGKNHFTQNGAKGTVENHGTINVPNGGVVALIGDRVTNTGTINTPKGTTALAAGKTVDLDFKGDGLVEVKVSEAALNAQITNSGAIQADGGRVVLTAKAVNSLIDTVINQQGVIKAQGLIERNGEIILEGDYVAQTGTLDVSGTTGGKVDINARAILDAGKTNADGTAGNGGTINLKASDAIIQTASANTHANGTSTGGTVHLEAVNSVFSSGKLSATGDTGGTIDVVSSDRVVLAAADVDASGTQQGGLVRVGGDFHGTNPNIKNAKTTIINSSTKIKADGGKGKVVVWSNTQTDYNGSISANKAGDIEVSSKGLLNYAGRADAGVGGSLLLDPKNIVISANAGVANYALIDPHAAAGNLFGANTAVLGTTVGGLYDSKKQKIVGGILTENGNIAVTSSGDSFVASKAGATYLFNTTTGALLSTLTGSKANDQVGSNGITALTNGNYVVNSNNWANGTVTQAGAVTWGNGLTGISGVVSSANSLVGSSVNDTVGSGKGATITALSNGNYVVASRNWDNGTIVNAGAATWGNGSTGISGTISSTNSLVGFNANDFVSSNGITALTNGNYVVASTNWNNGSMADRAGAATWGNGTRGTVGAVSSTNSLVGTASNDSVGSSITALINGNYVVSSTNWRNGTAFVAGAATWGNGATGISGIISATNSLVGTSMNDSVGSHGIITSSTNGNYVVSSGNWNNGTTATRAGAATWGNGLTGISGAVSSINSLVGTTTDDRVSINNITFLTNGNYVVNSPEWNNGTATSAGAATWGSGTVGISGAVSSSNSLVGSNVNDLVSYYGVLDLSNGNYVVNSPNWNNGTVTSAGAATWGSGTVGISGAVSSSNSLVGSNVNDRVGNDRLNALTNGNYVVGSPNWNNGTVTGAGAATWGNGTFGTNGIVTSTNSLVGTTANDNVSSNGITILDNGKYVVNSPNWNNGTVARAGAATWGNGSNDIVSVKGAVSSTNSLVGSTVNENVSNRDITALSNGNYVVVSSGNACSGSNKGSVTWGNGAIGRTGVVNSFNSLLGSVVGDFNTEGNLVTGLNNGNYVVANGVWDNGTLVDAGQVRILTPQNIYFNNGVGQNMTFNPSFITETLALGTAVTLQASNDITLNADINVTGLKGGDLTLQAGRNINLNAKIVTNHGDFTAVAGDPNAIAADRDAGTPTITLGSGATINAGTGEVILAAIGGNFVNNSGSTKPITASQWLVYSTDPSLNSRNGMQANQKHYAQTYTDGVTPSYVTVGSGNWFLYSITPTLTVTPSNLLLLEGSTLPPSNFFPFTLTGFIDGDTVGSSGIGIRTAAFGVDNYTGKAGSYNVDYLSGLASNLGYKFVNNTASINELTVIAKPAVPPVVVVKPIEPIESVRVIDYKPTIQVNVFNFNSFYSQTTPLNVSTTFNYWYHEKHAHHDDDVDYDFGQYKGDATSSKMMSYEWRSEHGKHKWSHKRHEYRHNRHEDQITYMNLLMNIEQGGMRFPKDWQFSF